MADHAPIHINDSVKARFWANVPNRDPNQCWEWQGYVAPSGYGYMKIKCKPRRAHRISLVIAGQTPPPGYVADHTCRNKRCVNPSHLRFVTNRTNSIENSSGITAINAAKTHCKRGHEFTPANILPNKPGARVCLTCYRTYHIRTHPGAKARASRVQERADAAPNYQGMLV